MREQVLTATIRRDEAKTLFVVEPLHDSSRHLVLASTQKNLHGEQKSIVQNVEGISRATTACALRRKHS